MKLVEGCTLQASRQMQCQEQAEEFLLFLPEDVSGSIKKGENPSAKPESSSHGSSLSLLLSLLPTLFNPLVFEIRT